MQDITSEHCTNTAEGFEKQLKDTRDGQLYWVGKMKDGRCWMLQNLALGSTSSDTTLTSANSNVASNWTLPQSYTSAKSGSSSAAAVQSWSFEKWVLATPLLTTGCGTSGIASIANCTRYGFVYVSDTTKFQPTYTATTGTWNGATVTSNTLVAVNCTSWEGSGTSKKCTAGTYDAHYLVGNYYSWNAAVANDNGSICPKGWELPIIIPALTAAPIGTKDFRDLLEAYGVGSSLSGTVNGVTYNIAGAPLRFVRSGNINPGSSSGNAGSHGYYWSSTISSSSQAYQLRISSGVDPANSSGPRSYGFSVRCVSQ